MPGVIMRVATVPDHPQTLKREVLLDALDGGRLAGEDVRHTAGRNAQRAIAVFQLGRIRATIPSTSET